MEKDWVNRNSLTWTIITQRFTTHATIKRALFETHYVRKPRLVITNNFRTKSTLLWKWDKVYQKFRRRKFSVHGKGNLLDHIVIAKKKVKPVSSPRNWSNRRKRWVSPKRTFSYCFLVENLILKIVQLQIQTVITKCGSPNTTHDSNGKPDIALKSNVKNDADRSASRSYPPENKIGETMERLTRLCVGRKTSDTSRYPDRNGATRTVCTETLRPPLVFPLVECGDLQNK